MAIDDWSDIASPASSGSDDWSSLASPVGEKPKKQDNPLVRGLTQANNARKTFGALATGDYEQAAKLAAERDAYQRANPGSPEGNELMAAWEKGDGIVGGIKGVAGEMAKDWREAPTGIAALQATGKNLAAMGGGIVEQVPNMIMPMAGMLAGGAAGSLAGPAGTVAGAFAGAATGNTAAESSEQVDRAIRGAGIDPQNTQAVRSFLEKDAGGVLGKSAVKGGIIGAVDTATMGIGGRVLNAPVRAATDRAIASLGIDAADKAAVSAARQQIGEKVASDAVYQASQKGAQALTRNLGVAALEPTGEFAGEYLGQGVATGDWDTKGAMLEALSSLGQSGITYAGQKIYQYATNPARGIKTQESTQAEQQGIQDEQQPIAGLLPPPTYTGTPGDQIIAADAERQSAIDAAEKNAADLYAMRDAFEKSRQDVALASDPVPLQQRIDAMLGLDTTRMDKKGRALYEKDLAAAFNEPVGITHDANQNEVPFTMGEYLDAQVKVSDVERARPLRANAADAANNRLAQLADEEAQQHAAITQDLVRSASQGGALSKAALTGIQTGATQMPVHPERAAIEQQMLMDEAAQAELAPVERLIRTRTDEQVQRIAENENANPKMRQAAIAEIQRRMTAQSQPTTTQPLAQTATQFNLPENVFAAKSAQMDTQAPQADGAQARIEQGAAQGQGLSGIQRKRTIENWTVEELKARLDRANSGSSPLTAESRQKIEAELAKRPVRKQVDHGLSVGAAPNAAQPISVRNGVIFIGDEPAVNYDTEQDITISDNATPKQIVDALKAGGAVATSQKFYGLPSEPKAANQKPNRRDIDATKDTLFQAIAKLGGMDTQELLGNGIDQKDITYETAARVSKKGKNAGKLGKKSRLPLSFGFNMPLHKRGGMSFDGMLEALKQHGYFPEDATKNDAIAAFKKELGGDAVVTPDAEMRNAEESQAAYEAEMQAEQEANDEIGYGDLNERERALVDFHAETVYDEDNPIEAFRRGMKSAGATEEEINEAIKQTFGAQETGDNDSGGTPQGTGETRDAQGAWNGSQDGEIQESAEPDWLTGQTNEQAAAELAKRKADIAEEKRQHDELIAQAKRESNAKEKARRAAQVLAEREAAKKAEVDKAAEDFALGQEAPAPVERKVTTEDARGQQDIFAQPKQDNPVQSNAKSDASLERTKERNEVRFETPYIGIGGNYSLVGYVWPNKKEEYIDRRGEDRVRTVSDWEAAVENLETGRQIVHQFAVKKSDGTEQDVSAETAAKLLGVSESTVRNNAKKQLEKAIAKEKARILEIKEADDLDAIDAQDSPAMAVSKRAMTYSNNSPMIERMAKSGESWAAIDNRIERESAGREKYRFLTKDGKFVWSHSFVKEGDEEYKRGWRNAEFSASEIWPAQPVKATTEAKAVEPWQMTQEEYVDSQVALQPNANLPAMRKHMEGVRNRASVEWGESREAAAIAGKPVKVKPAWMRAQKEWTDATGNGADEHYERVRDAVELGKPVPANVLADYPDLNPAAVDANKEAETDDGIRYSKVSDAPAGEELVAIHNLTAENVLHAAAIGGIPVPSIGITKLSSPFTDFGEITLIADKGMIDPENSVPVFDRDAYTARFPEFNYKKVTAKKADAFYERMNVARELSDDGSSFMSQLWDAVKNARVQSPKKVADLFRTYLAPRMLYAKEVLGKEIKAPMIPVKSRVFFGHEKSWIDFVKANEELRKADEDAYNKAASKAIKKAVDDFVNRSSDDEIRGAVRSAYKADIDRYVGDDWVNGNYLDWAIQDAKSAGTKRVDAVALSNRVAKIVPQDDPGYLKWVSNEISDLFVAPTITLRGKEVEASLDNIVEAMTIGKTNGAEKTMTFGVGKTSALLGKRFKSIKEIQDHRNQVVSSSRESDMKKDSEKLLEEYRMKAVEHFTHTDWRGRIDTFAGFDAAMEALAKAGKRALTDGNIASAMRSVGFKNVPSDVINLARQGIVSIREASTDYFEAKPQRAVKLNEFNGAVVPNGTDQEVIDALKSSGITDIRTYKRGDAEGRKKSVALLAKKIHAQNKNTLFSNSAEGAAQPEPFPRTQAESRIKSILGDKLGKVLIDSGIVTLVDTEQGLRNLNGAKYMVAWHGSPHDHNKFDSSKIGTGEGAQAYGYGHYFASSKDVAEWYRDKLGNVLYNGKPVEYEQWIIGKTNHTPLDIAVQEVSRILNKSKPSSAFGQYIQGKSFDDAVAEARIGFNQQLAGLKTMKQDGTVRKMTASLNKAVEELSRLRKQDFSVGKLYQVELAPSEDEYLDWDKPLSEQSELVRNALNGETVRNRSGQNIIELDPTGEEIVSALGKGEGASYYLHSIGIRGIKYLDGSSRGKTSGISAPAWLGKEIPDSVKSGAHGIFSQSGSAGDVASTQSILEKADEFVRRNVASLLGSEIPPSKKDQAYSLIGNAKLLSNLGERRSAIEHGFSSLNVPSKRMVLNAVSRVLQNTKVRDAVIRSIPIDVVHMLAGQKSSPESLFNDIPMLLDLLSGNGDKPVPMSINAADSTVSVIARSATEKITSIFEKIGGLENRFSALLASDDWHVEPQFAKGNYNSIFDSEGYNFVIFSDDDISITAKYAKQNGGIQGATFPDGRIALVLENLNADNFDGVFAHEGFHSTIRNLVGEQTYAKLMKQLENMHAMGKGAQWVKDANAAIPSDTKAEHRTEELAAYAIEQYVNGAKQPNIITRWVESLLSALRTAIIRKLPFGKLKSWAVNNLQPQDLANLAIAGLKAKARGQLQVQGREATAYSKINQTDTPAFKKWFGKSAVVDANGKPLVVYHGTNADFSVFKTTRSGEFGPAIYLTDNPREAGEYGEAVKGISFAPPSANIMPVYARIENPYTKGVDAFWKEFGRSDSDAAGVERAKAAGYDGIIAKRADRYYDNVAHEFVDLGNTLTHYIAFSNTQVKSAIGNNGDFGTNPDIRYSRAQIIGDSGRPYDQTQRQFFKNVGRDIDKKNLVERTTEYLKNDFWKKMAVGIVDQFRGLRDLGDNGQAYMLARLSKGTAGAFDALLHHGKLSIRDGVYDADTSGGFIDRLGTPLHGELDDFLWYVAANRAEGLSKADRENLFTPADIAAGKSLARGQTNFDYTIQTGPQKGTTTRNRTLIYADANRVFNEFQKNTLDMAEQSGLIDGASRKLWESEFYVPFYRVSEEDGEFIGAKMGNALVRQQAFKKLKGGTDKLNSDLLSNTLLNFSHLIEASAKNRAAKASLAAAEQIGVAERVAPDMASYTASNGSMLPPGTKGTVWFQENGKKVEYKVTDPFVMTAITSLEYAGMRNGVMDVMTKFKHWLTIGVTASPAFKVRNLIRDSIQSIGASDLSYNPIKNIAEGYKQTKRDSQEYVSALASGGLIRFGTMLEGSESSRVRQLVKSGVKDSTILNSENKWRAFYDQYLDPVVSAYNELGNRSEEINRAALYNQLIKQGKSHAEAALLARDLMDFSMQGSFNTIRFLTQVVPFMNARLQGMYKLGRAAKDNPRKLAVVTGAVALASIALMLAYGDDDDWKRREDWDRDGFWWFKFGGVEFRIPKPFEVGAIGSLAERGLELMIDDEMTGERFRRVVNSLVMNNLSMNPLPQAFKPILDLYANKDSFTGRPIESMGMQRLDPTERFNSNTSMIARGMSNASFGALSPVQIDHLARAYFGWLGSFVIGGADMAFRGMSDQPTRPALDYFKFGTQGILKEAGTGSSRYVTQVYEQAKELEQAHATYRQMIKDGRIDEAKDYAADNQDKMIRYRQVEAVKKVESNLNERIRKIERSDMDSGEKKDAIALINKQKEQVAKRIAAGAS